MTNADDILTNESMAALLRDMAGSNPNRKFLLLKAATRLLEQDALIKEMTRLLEITE